MPQRMKRFFKTKHQLLPPHKYKEHFIQNELQLANSLYPWVALPFSLKLRDILPKFSARVSFSSGVTLVGMTSSISSGLCIKDEASYVIGSI